MEHGYLVKVTAYIDTTGSFSLNPKNAEPFSSIDEATDVAATCGGHLIKVIKPPARERSSSRKNQNWMRGM